MPLRSVAALHETSTCARPASPRALRAPARRAGRAGPPAPFELGHRPGRTEDLDAVHGARSGQRVWRDFVERSDVFDELLEAGGC